MGPNPLADAAMETIHSNQIATIFKALASAFGRDAALAQAQQMLDRTLLGNAGKSSTEGALLASPDVQLGALASGTEPTTDFDASTNTEHPCELNLATVLGIPDGYTWEQAPVEVKLSKKALQSATAEQNGVVLRHEDSEGGDLYYAVYDSATKTFKVPAGYSTSRGKASEITFNGAYRWLLAGVARSVNPKSQSRRKSRAKTAPVSLPKWRGREYEPCHEQMAHTGNVQVGSLVRDTVKGTLDYVTVFDGRSALIERENSDLDEIKLTAEPSKLLRVVGYSSQYAQEVAARG